VIRHHEAEIAASSVHLQLDVKENKYFLVTMHRAENVDVPDRLSSLVAAFGRLRQEYGVPVIISTHPRTRSRMEEAGISEHHPDVRFLEPFGFFDFIALEKAAFCVLSDSGTVQEECAILRVPNVTIRDVTERPETLECGSNMLSGADPESVLGCVRTVLAFDRNWSIPSEYLVETVSETVVRFLLGYHHRSV
jgi:UDP-N-acetylglucosamine 2-epimerase (non-hydrolysing)